MPTGLEVVQQAAQLLEAGPVNGAADLHPGAPRLTIVSAIAEGTHAEPRLTISFKSSAAPTSNLRVTFSEVPYDEGSFSDRTPEEVCTHVRIALLEAVETNTLEDFSI